MKLFTKKKKAIQLRDKMIETLRETIDIMDKTEESLHGIISTHEETIERLSEEVKELRKTNDELLLLIPSKFPFQKIMEDCALAAWVGEKSKRIFESTDGKVKLLFVGTVYERFHEEFVPDCNVFCMENEMTEKQLLGSKESKENVLEYILKKNIGYKEVELNNNTENKIPTADVK